MKKKLKLFSTIAVLCLSLAMLVFGVFSALTVSYKTYGRLTYDVNNTYVELETRVYSCEKNYKSDTTLKLVSQSYESTSFEDLDKLTQTGVIEGENTYSFNKVQIKNLDKGEGYLPKSTDYYYTYSSVSEKDAPQDLVLDVSYTPKTEAADAVYTYFVITKVTSKSVDPVYVHVPITGEDKYVEPNNSYTYKLPAYTELATKDSSTNIVFAFSLKNGALIIDEEDFVLPVEVTREVPEIEGIYVDAQETVYKSETPISTELELVNYINAIINGTQTLSASAGIEPAPQSTAPEQISGTAHEYNSETGVLISGTRNLNTTGMQNNQTYIVVLEISNKGQTTVYTKLSKSTSTVTGARVYISDSYLRLLSGQTQKIVLAYNVTNATQLSQQIQIEFEVVAAETPYNYADLHAHRDEYSYGFLYDYQDENWDHIYSYKIKNITFTNNKADIGDISKVVDTFKVGVITNEDKTQSDMLAYFVPNGELFDVYTYAPVNVIYSPVDCYGLFGEWFNCDDSYEAGSYSVSYSLSTVEYMYFNNFDTSKSLSFYGMFGSLKSLKRIYGLDTFDTSNVINFSGLFLGCPVLHLKVVQILWRLWGLQE